MRGATYFEPIDSTPGYEYYEPGDNMLHINYLRGDQDVMYLNDVDALVSRLIPAHILYQSALTYRFTINVSANRTRYVKDFLQCGTYPDISTLGLAERPEVDVDSVSAVSTVKTFKSCGTISCGSGAL